MATWEFPLSGVCLNEVVFLLDLDWKSRTTKCIPGGDEGGVARIPKSLAKIDFSCK